MIAPTSTFYNPEDTSLQPDLGHVQYQQWVEAYSLQQQQQQQQQDQQNQQSQHHYSQQMVYDPNYHGGTSLHASISQINPSYTFTQPQYESSSSLSQYDGSTTNTVTQSNAGQIQHPLSSYQGQSNGMYPQVYSELISMQQSAVSTPERTPEGANYSYSTPPNQGPQQTLSQQSQQSQQQQVRRKPPVQPSKVQQPESHAHRFVAHPSSSESRQHTSSNPSSSHPSPLTPSTTVWNSEPGYSNPKPKEKANNRAQSSLRVPSTKTGSRSQNAPSAKTNSLNLIQFIPTTSRVSESNPLSSPTGTSFVPEKTGHKRKRAKKNEPAQWSGTGEESDSDSEDDEGGGISVGMGGLGVVGKRGTKGSRL